MPASTQRVTLVRPVLSIVYKKVYKDIPKDREIRPPLGLLCLAAALEQNGVKVTIIDAEPQLLSVEECVQRIVASEPHFVGVTSTTPEFQEATDIIKGVKKYDPSIITIMGGAHVSALPEQSLYDNPELDYVVVGEGEESIKKIVKEKPKQRIVVSEAIQDLDSLPLPARHLIDYDNYRTYDPDAGIVKADAI